MPILFGDPNLTYDLKGVVDEPEPSLIIENERRLFYVALTRAKKAVLLGTCEPSSDTERSRPKRERPSRFIHETEYVASTAVMTPLQRLATGDPHAKRALLAAVKTYGSNKRVMKSLIETYLPQFGDTALTTEARTIEASKPELKFEYPKSLQMVGTDASATVESSSKLQWWEHDDPF